jgi:hypothetical protein
MKRWHVVVWVALAAGAALAQNGGGGLYIAGAGFSFKQAVTQGLAKNPGGTRFFVLALPPQTKALALDASANRVADRRRAGDGGAVFLVCQRDVDKGAVVLSKLVPGVVPVRGWPPPGSNELPKGQLFYADEDPTKLPASVTLLRRLRATCS